MTLFPRSFFGRTALLIVLLIVVGQLGGALLVRQMALEPRLAQIVDGVARNMAAIRAGLAALPPAQRQAFVDGYNGRTLAERHAAEGEAPPTLTLTPMERRLVHSVSARIAQQGIAPVWRREANGGLALRLMLDGSAYWVVMPGGAPVREFSGAWVATWFGSVLLALAGALWFQRRLDRPLRRVVEAAQELAQGREPAPLPEDGPTEIATVSRSFNRLVGSLRQTERDRALMLAGISHDLRTPLTKLCLGVEILRPRVEPELASSMTRSVEEMDAIVGQFLDFARGEDSEPMIEVDLRALVFEVQAAFADHGRAVAVEEGAAVPPMPSAPMRPQAMRRVLVNLVENAWRHGRPPVVVRLGAEAAGVWFEVADRGEGIAAELAEALKQPFRRAGGAREGASGAGLGLAIVERIVRSHGGRFELLAAEGGGLRARVTLPLAQAGAC
jgi:two-component system osmolarity sensor histidine kinase EnvZ